MLSATGRFRRTDRILRSSGFTRVMKLGDRRTSRNFVVFAAVDESGTQPARPGRIGITVSKRVGNAVVRNHVKRRVREWYRASRQRLPIGTELVVIARRPSRDLETRDLFEDLDQVIGKFKMGTVN